MCTRPPSSSLSAYGGMVNDDVRSPSSGGGTPGLLPPSSHLSGDNMSEAGKRIASIPPHCQSYGDGDRC
eukprot:TCALIF_12762-PA protein Name:"Protein of unknown function" AED:0.15 eAED:0.17 QI:0/0/0/0.5/1/1/2/0/68